MRENSKRAILSIALIFLSSLSSAAEIASQIGRSVSEDLRQVLRGDTTALRKESKAVLSEDTLRAIGETLAKGFFSPQGPVTLRLNFRNKKMPSAKNGTFTFYGQRVFFEEGGLKTSIKLRARFYFDIGNDGSLSRSLLTRQEAYLELKIKNPEPDLENVVNKFRIKIADQDLLQLFNADASQPEFPEILSQIERNVTALPSNSADQDLVPIFFKTLRALVQYEPQFINPTLGIYYERVSLAYTEKDYQSENILDPVSVGDVEYQFTIDRNVRGYVPKVYGDPSFSFEDYFREGMTHDWILSYPEDTVVVEAKVPISVANLSGSQKSLMHNFIDDAFIDKMTQDGIRESAFKANRGKAAHLRKFINAKAVL